MPSIQEIIRIHDQRVETHVRYPVEYSSVDTISADFLPFEGKSFLSWLKSLSARKEFSVFEFGGGAAQVAAIEILKTYVGVRQYVGYEIRPLDPEAKTELSTFPNYQYVNGGLAGFDDKVAELNDSPFDLAFAHHVANTLVHPFLAAAKLYEILKSGGLLFMDRIGISQWVGEETIVAWKRKGYRFAADFKLKPWSSHLKSGLGELNIVFQKTKRQLWIPEATNQHLTDYQGNPLITLVYENPKKPTT